MSRSTTHPFITSKHPSSLSHINTTTTYPPYPLTGPGEGMELKERLSVLLQQRSELDRLRGLLETWKEEEPEEDEEEEGEGEDEYDVSDL